MVAVAISRALLLPIRSPNITSTSVYVVVQKRHVVLYIYVWSYAQEKVKRNEPQTKPCRIYSTTGCPPITRGMDVARQSPSSRKLVPGACEAHTNREHTRHSLPHYTCRIFFITFTLFAVCCDHPTSTHPISHHHHQYNATHSNTALLCTIPRNVRKNISHMCIVYISVY